MEQTIDTTLLPKVLSNATVGDVFELNIPARFEYLSLVSATINGVLNGLAIKESETTIYNIQLAVHENCTNIMEHAYADMPVGRLRMNILLIVEPLAMVINLFDSGRSFNLDDIEPPDFDGLQERGLGLFLLEELMDDVQYFPQAGNNHWQLTKYLATQSHNE